MLQGQRSNSATPLVSVSIITYRQAEYLPTAIDSALAQVTDFPFEIVVGVDGGDADGGATARVAMDYAARYPDQVRAICHERRGEGIPGRVNNITNLASCRGEYIAMLDGDDYWLDTDKLQRQVDLLKSDPSISLVFHDVEVFYEDSSQRPHSFLSSGLLVKDLDKPARFGLRQLARFGHSTVPTASMMYRASNVQPLPAWFSTILAADFALVLLSAAKGEVAFQPGITSCYRRHSASESLSGWHSDANLVTKYEELSIYAEHFGLPLSTFARMRAWLLYTQSVRHARRGAYATATWLLKKAIGISPVVVAKRGKDTALRCLRVAAARVQPRGKEFRSATQA